MSDSIMGEKVVTAPVIDNSPKGLLIKDLKAAIVDTKSNVGMLGQVLNTLVEVYPPAANMITPESIEATEEEMGMSVNGEHERVNVLIKIHGKNSVPANITRRVDIEDIQTIQFELSLGEVCKPFGRNDFKLGDLEDPSIFDLETVAEEFHKIGEVASKSNNSNWNVVESDPTVGPYIIRETPHGQSFESFAQVISNATNNKLQLEIEK